MKNKIRGAIAVIGIVMLAMMAGCGCGKGEESYRKIQVHKVDGTSEVERETIGVLEAYANMMLQSKDNVSVFAESNMQVKLDEDKYILLEPGTKIRLEAEGDSQDSKTKIYLEEGAIVCNLENDLSEGATFEVNTPNSTMAVRGTTFRVALEYDEEGTSYTEVGVYEGRVESFLVYPNGEVSEEGVSIPAGKQVQVKGTEEDSVYIVTDQEIVYEELKEVTLNFLKEVVEKEIELSITEEEIDIYIENIKAMESLEGTEELESTENTELESEEIEETESETEEEDEREVVSSEPVEETEFENTEETEMPEEDTSLTEENTPSDNNSSGDDSSSSAPSVTPVYTVTFSYDGVAFGTQRVTQGQCAVEPSLMPTSEGHWDFDFTQAITKNITVEWVDESAS